MFNCYGEERSEAKCALDAIWRPSSGILGMGQFKQTQKSQGNREPIPSLMLKSSQANPPTSNPSLQPNPSTSQPSAKTHNHNLPSSSPHQTILILMTLTRNTSAYPYPTALHPRALHHRCPAPVKPHQLLDEFPVALAPYVEAYARHVFV